MEMRFERVVWVKLAEDETQWRTFLNKLTHRLINTLSAGNYVGLVNKCNSYLRSCGIEVGLGILRNFG